MFSLNQEHCTDLLQRIQKHCIQEGLRIATAESCTGGMLGALLTERSGSSVFYQGGIVAYDNAVKKKLLGVSEADLEKFGAVSAQVARSMAVGVCQLLRTELALAVTGIAGPGGGSSEKPVGTVFGAWATPYRSHVERWQLTGDRATIRAETCLKALEGLLRFSIDKDAKGSGVDP